MPTIAQVTEHFDALEDAAAEARRTGSRARSALREQCHGACKSDMEQWASYARAVAMKDPGRAPQIIASSGFDERAPTTRRKGDFEVTFPRSGWPTRG